MRQDNLSHIPGPKGIPIFENVFQMGMENYHHWITDQMKKFGPIIKLKLLTSNVVIVSGKDEIRQVLVTKGNDFSGRPQTFRTEKGYPKVFVLTDYTRSTRKQKKMIMNTKLLSCKSNVMNTAHK